MDSGLWNQEENKAFNTGSMAIFCPACPQPGINLPDDWKERYTSYEFIQKSRLLLLRNELIQAFIMDGNFSAEHMKCRTKEADVPLYKGVAFMADPVSYNAHLHSGHEVPQVCGTSLQCLPSLQVNSQAHVTHTKLLSKQIQGVHTFMLQGSGQPHAAMDSLCLHQ